MILVDLTLEVVQVFLYPKIPILSIVQTFSGLSYRWASWRWRRVSCGYPTLRELDHKVQVQPGKELTWESLDALRNERILHTLKINFWPKHWRDPQLCRRGERIHQAESPFGRVRERGGSWNWGGLPWEATPVRYKVLYDFWTKSVQRNRSTEAKSWPCLPSSPWMDVFICLHA